MAITLDGSTGIGTPDITSTAAPALVGTNFTSLPSSVLTGALPAISGASLTALDASKLTGALPTISGAALTGIISPIKAWVNFRGRTTVSIRESFNVTSVTDSGTGTYTINFTTAMADVNYILVSSNPVATDGTKGSVGLNGGYNSGAVLKTTTAVRIKTGGANQTASADFEIIDVAIIR